jgi:hypothetical protein
VALPRLPCSTTPLPRSDEARCNALDILQAFFDLENGNQELKSDLKDLYINTAM